MERIFFAILLFLTCVTSGWAGKAVTWNMEYFPAGSPQDAAKAQVRMKAAQDALVVLDADILLLQEVNDWKAVMDLTAPLKGMQAHSVTSFGGPQQMAIASRWPVDAAWYEAFKSYEGEQKGPPRGFAFAALRSPDRGYILSYSVHLKSNRGDKTKNVRAREEAAKQLVSHIAQYREVYEAKGKVFVILAGDFNTLQDDPVYSQEQTIPILKAAGLTWCWEGVPREHRATWPAQGGFKDATFDHFFHTFADGAVKVLPHSSVSDHSAVILTFGSKEAGSGRRP